MGEENRVLKGQSAKSEWAFTSMLRTRGLAQTHTKSDGKEKEKEKEKEKDRPKEKEKRRNLLGDMSPKRTPIKERSRMQINTSPETFDKSSAETLEGMSIRLCSPLSSFWEDVPCCGLPLMKSGSEVHIKFGQNILMVDDHGKHLVWKNWMNTEAGYTLSQTFFIEKRPPQRAGGSK